MNRRGFLKMVPSAGAAAAIIKPSDLLGEAVKHKAGASGRLAMVKETEAGVAPEFGAKMADKFTRRNKAWDHINRMRSDAQLEAMSEADMPVGIRSKRSWSPAYKSLVASQSQREMNALYAAMNSDETLIDKIADMLLGKDDE